MLYLRVIFCCNDKEVGDDPKAYSFNLCSRVSIFVETSKPRPTRARVGKEELADEAELVSLSVG